MSAMQAPMTIAACYFCQHVQPTATDVMLLSAKTLYQLMITVWHNSAFTAVRVTSPIEIPDRFRGIRALMPLN